MLIVIQFPIADSRRFLNNVETGMLKRPDWHLLSSDADFVRSFGIIRRRWRGGVQGGVGENEICEAKNAIRFHNLTLTIHSKQKLHIKLRIAFRRFYFDGFAVGKFEIGLFLPKVPSCISNEQLIESLIKLPVSIPHPVNKEIQCKLLGAGKHLAELYRFSSTTTSHAIQNQSEKFWVQSCQPILLIEQRSYENLTIPSYCMQIPIRELPLKVSHYMIPFKGVNLRLWLIQEVDIPVADITYRHHSIQAILQNIERNGHYDYDDESIQHNEEINKREDEIKHRRKVTREFRISLLRIHAERECLKKILLNVGSGKIKVSRDRDNEDLQKYLNKATKYVTRLEKKHNLTGNLDIISIANEAEDFVNAGTGDAILEKLKSIRRNIFRKVETFVDQQMVIKQQININQSDNSQINIGEKQIMGDEYKNFGQSAIVGPGGHAHDNEFNQIGSQTEKTIDMSQLANELFELRQAMKKEAAETGTNHDIAIGEVNKAEDAAKAGEGLKVAEYLKAAGNWALEIATKIGTTIATEAIKTAMGIK